MGKLALPDLAWVSVIMEDALLFGRKRRAKTFMGKLV